MSKTTPSIIKLAGTESKDSPGIILKKLKKYDKQFCEDCDIEIKACLDKHYLPFDEFSTWLQESYLRYIIRTVYIYSVNPDSSCAALLEQLYIQSLQQLRKCIPKVKDPIGVLHDAMASIWCSTYTLFQDYRPDMKVEGCHCITELDLNTNIDIHALIRKDRVLSKLQMQLDSFKYTFEDYEVYKFFPVFYAAWLQAVLAWDTPAELLAPIFDVCVGKTQTLDMNLKRKKKNQK
jgi:hypothetical protein